MFCKVIPESGHQTIIAVISHPSTTQQKTKYNKRSYITYLQNKTW